VKLRYYVIMTLVLTILLVLIADMSVEMMLGFTTTHYTLYLQNQRIRNIKRLSLDGTIETISGDNGSIDCFDICDDEILFIGLRGLKLQVTLQFKI